MRKTTTLVISGVIAWFAMLLMIVAMVGSVPQQQMANTIVKVTPSKTVLSPGETFTVTVSVEPAAGVNIAGAQFNLAFNPQSVQINSVVVGNLFGANPVYFQSGMVDNITGTLKNLAMAITVPGGNATAPGTIAVITCTAVAAGQTSMFALSNVIVGNMDAVALPLESPIITQIQVASSWDLNLDGVTNNADMALITNVFGQTGTPGFLREDLKGDGVIDVLDLILEGQHFLA
jgi:hypothetical protein